MSTDFLAILNRRRSTRKFLPDPIGEQDIHDLLEAAMNAPSAINEQAWQFVVPSGRVLDDYLKINSNTPQGSPAAILVCRDLGAEKAPGCAVQDCAAAAQNILLAAHAKGLGAVWTTVFPDNANAVRALPGIPEHVVPFACVPIGRPEQCEAGVPGTRYDKTKVHRQGWGKRCKTHCNPVMAEKVTAWRPGASIGAEPRPRRRCRASRAEARAIGSACRATVDRNPWSAKL